MSVSKGPAITPNPSFARLLAALSIVLLRVFLAAVPTTALPAQVLDPGWQLQVITSLINYATLPQGSLEVLIR